MTGCEQIQQLSLLQFFAILVFASSFWPIYFSILKWAFRKAGL